MTHKTTSAPDQGVENPLLCASLGGEHRNEPKMHSPRGGYQLTGKRARSVISRFVRRSSSGSSSGELVTSRFVCHPSTQQDESARVPFPNSRCGFFPVRCALLLPG